MHYMHGEKQVDPDLTQVIGRRYAFKEGKKLHPVFIDVTISQQNVLTHSLRCYCWNTSSVQVASASFP